MCGLCCLCDFLFGFGVCLCPSSCLSWESRLASCCHHPHLLHFPADTVEFAPKFREETPLQQSCSSFDPDVSARRIHCVLYNWKKRTVSVCRGQCLRSVHSDKCWNWEYIHSPTGLEALFTSSQSSFVTRASQDLKSYFLVGERVRGPSICFVKRSAVLSFVFTRPTDRRSSLIHHCKAKHRISMDLSPTSPLRCRMWRAQPISRRTQKAAVKFLDVMCETQKFSSACTGCVELCSARTETDCCLFQISVAHRHSLWLQWKNPQHLEALPYLRPTQSHYDQQVQPNLFEPSCMVQDDDKYCAYLWDIVSSVSLRACSLLLYWRLVWIVVGWRVACLFSKVPWRWVFRRLCESWSNDGHPQELLSWAPSLSSFWIDSRFRVFQPVKIREGFRKVSTVYHLELPARLPRVIRFLSYEPTCRFFFFAEKLLLLRTIHHCVMFSEDRYTITRLSS